MSARLCLGWALVSVAFFGLTFGMAVLDGSARDALIFAAISTGVVSAGGAGFYLVDKEMWR